MGTELQVLEKALESTLPALQKVAQKHLTPERLIRILLSACSRNPKLLTCSLPSVTSFCMKCAETGLSPIGAGGAWPVPYNNNKTNTCEMQFIPDYRGLINCAIKDECILDAYAATVRQNDEFDYSLGLHPDLVHKPAKKDRGELVNAYCVYTLMNGDKQFVVMDSDEIESCRNRSKAKDAAWASDASEMWKKTVIKRAMKPFVGRSSTLNAAMSADNDVNGIDFGREPIAMPTAKVVEPEPPVKPTQEAPPEKQPPVVDVNPDDISDAYEPPLGDNAIFIDALPTLGAKGKRQFFSYENIYYSTFSTTIADRLKALVGQSVEIEFVVTDERNRKIMAIKEDDLPV